MPTSGLSKRFPWQDWSEEFELKKSFIASAIYLVLGLASGVFYREFTKLNGFEPGQYTQLSVVHTHLLTLGFLVFLIVLLLDNAFKISDDWRFKTFFWLYNAGLVLSTSIMVLRGVQTVLGAEMESGAIAGIAGLGHIMLSLALGLLLIILGIKIWSRVGAETANAVK